MPQDLQFTLLPKILRVILKRFSFKSILITYLSAVSLLYILDEFSTSLVDLHGSNCIIIFQLPWPMSTPVKQVEPETQALLEEEFSDENSSDEDYKPNEEEVSFFYFLILLNALIVLMLDICICHEVLIASPCLLFYNSTDCADKLFCEMSVKIRIRGNI